VLNKSYRIQPIPAVFHATTPALAPGDEANRGGVRRLRPQFASWMLHACHLGCRLHAHCARASVGGLFPQPYAHSMCDGGILFDKIEL
jgi:hypothetical protein